MNNDNFNSQAHPIINQTTYHDKYERYEEKNSANISEYSKSSEKELHINEYPISDPYEFEIKDHNKKDLDNSGMNLKSSGKSLETKSLSDKIRKFKRHNINNNSDLLTFENSYSENIKKIKLNQIKLRNSNHDNKIGDKDLYDNSIQTNFDVNKKINEKTNSNIVIFNSMLADDNDTRSGLIKPAKEFLLETSVVKPRLTQQSNLNNIPIFYNSSIDTNEESTPQYLNNLQDLTHFHKISHNNADFKNTEITEPHENQYDEESNTEFYDEVGMDLSDTRNYSQYLDKFSSNYTDNEYFKDREQYNRYYQNTIDIKHPEVDTSSLFCIVCGDKASGRHELNTIQT
jgi:hypothetical protein